LPVFCLFFACFPLFFTLFPPQSYESARLSAHHRVAALGGGGSLLAAAVAEHNVRCVGRHYGCVAVAGGEFDTALDAP
jgi:hypothetical protein